MDLRGVVFKSTGSWYIVKTDDGRIVDCRIRGNLRLKGSKSTNPVVVGDYVQITAENDNEFMIFAVEDRKNYLVRKSVNLSRQSHIMAANIDEAFLVVTVNYPPTYTTFIDRFLATAEAYNIKGGLIFNKIDILSEQETETLNSWIDTYEKIGYKCIKTSVKTGENFDEIVSELTNKTTLLSGYSGVGKTSLINKLVPEANLATSILSKSHDTGKHTTTFSEMIPLPFGGFIIDSPGIRSFGTYNFDREEIYHFFPEIFKIASGCKYHNCLHLQEPECAVIKAIEEGEISFSRYTSYLSILEDPEDNNKFRV